MKDKDKGKELIQTLIRIGDCVYCDTIDVQKCF